MVGQSAPAKDFGLFQTHALQYSYKFIIVQSS